jgi:predicted lipoprotein with Yx(FWY)xxD motif
MQHSEPVQGSEPRRRKRRAYFPLAVGAASLGLATLATMGGPASATGTAKVAARVTTSAKVVVDKVRAGKYGQVLVDQKGLALYYDTANKPAHFACTGACLTAWPPLVLGKGQTAAVAGKGVTGLGTVRGPSGLQVTWKGNPLYTFIKDTKGTVTGQGIGHVWFVAQPSRAATKVPAPRAAAPTTAAPTTAAPTTAAPTTAAPTTAAPTTAAPTTTAPTTTAPMTTVPPVPVAY